MRMFTLSLGRASTTGRIIYGIGLASLVLLVILTLVMAASLTATLVSVVLVAGFMVSAPFLLSGRWRAPTPQSTRRPVVRRRRY